MGTDQNGGTDEIQVDIHTSFSEISPSLNKQTRISSQLGHSKSSRHLGVENKSQALKKPKRSFVKYFIKPPRRPGFPKLGVPTPPVSPSATLQTIANARDGGGSATPARVEPLHGLKDGVKVRFVGEIRWVVLKDAAKQWLRNPKNLPLLIWGIGVAVSGTIYVLVLLGLLNTALTIQTQRDTWSEVSNQILNALFTLMCLYEQPRLCYHLLRLIRWKPEDNVKLRKFYCKKGTHKPHEWAHMMVVVLLLQLTIFAQYAVSGLNWAYNKSDRPAIGVYLCNGVSTGAFVAAVLYLILSPLRKDYEAEIDLGAVNSPSQVNSGMLPLLWPDMLPPAVNSASRVNSGMPPLNAQATVPTVLLGWPDILPPAVNSASRVNSGMLYLNAQAWSPIHYSVRNSLPPQGLPFWREGFNSFRAETQIAISPASESETQITW